MPEQLTTTIRAIEDGIAAGLHPGAQLFVARDGEVVADLACGEARPGVAMRPDSVVLWMSSAKPIAAIAVAQLVERGRLELDQPVAVYLPEFAAADKETITVRQVLTHTGGFRNLAAPWQSAGWDDLVAQVCAMPREPVWEPGQRAGYHIATSWVILGELVRRIDGRSFDTYVREEIFLPLGLADSWVGLPAEAYAGYGERLALMHRTDGGRVRSAGLDDPAQAALVRPGGNGRGPIRELGRFYEALRRGGQGLVQPTTVAEWTRRQRVGMFDETFQHQLDWGLGFILNSNCYGADSVPYGFGPFAGPHTYGHGGNQSSCAFCDPQHGLVVAWVCNGMPGEEAHQARLRRVNAAIYQDLGLAA